MFDSEPDLGTMVLALWKSRLSTLPEQLLFSRWPIDSRTVFHITDSTFAFTNLKPVIPGHVLVSPLRVVDRMSELSCVEVQDLFASAQLVGKAILMAHPHADSLTFTVQDGRSAGQTVPHVHVHIIPRWATDRFNSSSQGNDSVYVEIEKSEAELAMGESQHVEPRSKEEMVQEGQELRKIVELIISAAE